MRSKTGSMVWRTSDLAYLDHHFYVLIRIQAGIPGAILTWREKNASLFTLFSSL
jgi:hypothetical protein